MFEKKYFFYQNYAQTRSENGVSLLKILISYPCFLPNENKYNPDFINSFYQKTSENCISFANGYLYENILSEYNSDTNPRKKFIFKKYSYIIECKITYISDRLASVLFHILLKRNGKIINSKHISQTWDLLKNCIYPLSAFKKILKTDVAVKKFDGYYILDDSIVLFSNSSDNNTYNEKIIKNVDIHNAFFGAI